MTSGAREDRALGRLLAPAAGLVAASILAAQLVVPPVVGLANNGDFERVMGYVGFQYLTTDAAEKYFSWIVTKFAFGPPGWFRSGLWSSETLLAWAARLVSEPFSRGAPFDLRVLGGIHAALLAAALVLLVSATRPLPLAARLCGAALLVFVFTDVGYAAPLNSFFTQAASLVFLLLALGVAADSAASGRRGVLRAALYFLLAALFVGSKPQEAIQAPLLALLGVRVYGNGLRRPLRQPAWWAAALLCAFGAWYYRQTPAEISDVAKYHKVFMELLPNSPDPAGDLAALGLDPSWTSAMGRIAYAPGSPFQDPAFRAEFLRRFRYSRLLGFYATHPRRLASTLRRGGRQALTLRHPRFGNLEHRPGVPPGAKATSFSAWSRARAGLPGHPLWWLVPLLAGSAVVAAATRRRASPRGRLARDGIVVLVAMAACAFLVCVLANAHGDLPRHLYVFHALCDLILIADVVWIVAALSGRRRTAAGQAPVSTASRNVTTSTIPRQP